jgi:hypothetical protein
MEHFKETLGNGATQKSMDFILRIKKKINISLLMQTLQSAMA